MLLTFAFTGDLLSNKQLDSNHLLQQNKRPIKNLTGNYSLPKEFLHQHFIQFEVLIISLRSSAKGSVGFECNKLLELS